MAARRQRLFRVLAVCGAVCASWGIAELGLFLSGINNPYRELPTSQLRPRAGGPYDLTPCGHVPYATIRFCYPTNPRGYFNRDHCVDHVMNSAGWRDREHRQKKEPGTFRILGLGDSYLFGQGVNPDDRCLERMAVELRRSWPGRKLETINTGQPGYNTVMEARLLSQCGWKYDPDLVVLCFVPNDVEPDVYTKKPKVEFFTEYSVSYVGTDWASRHSEVWALARRSILGQLRGRNYLRNSIESFTTDPEKWRQCQEALADLAQQCRDREVKLLVVVFPFFYQLQQDYPFQIIHDRVTEFCRESQIPCLDLRGQFGANSGPELWVHPTDQHPNEIAHRLAGEAIARFCREHAQELGFDSAAPANSLDQDAP